jgi:hypothetical protein
VTPTPTAVQPTLASIQSNIFNVKCAVASCHTSGGIAPFSLESGLAYSNLVNATSAYGNPRLLRVKPNDAANSSLYLKLLGDPITGGPQARMPAGLGPMPINEINAIRDWINNGALPDSGGIVNSVRIVRPNNTTIQVGASLDLNAQAFDANNNPVSAIFTWSSNAPAVATVDSNSGLVTGVSIGSATITATASGLSDTLSVTIVAAPALQATLSSIQALIFTPKCVNAGCHPGGGAPMSLADTTTSFATLVNVNSAQFGRPRVAPGNANNSVLYLKVIADPSVGRGMPVIGAPLSKTETDSIAAWINRGALKN